MPAFPGQTGGAGRKHNREDAIHVSGAGYGQKMQEEREIRLTWAGGLGSIREGC